MSKAHFNRLTPAEAERLAILMEEMAEAIQIVGKIQRHGYESTNPTLPHEEQLTNRELLTKELGDVQHAIGRLCAAEDVSAMQIDIYACRKAESIKKWLHHQPKSREGS